MTGRISNTGLLIIYIVVAGCSVMSQMLPIEWQATLKYDRDTLPTTIYWSWLTAHFLHLNWIHLLLNLSGLGLILMLFKEVWTYAHLALLSIISLAAITTALWVFSPEINWYVGLSGVLHGLIAAGALLSFKQQRNTSLLILSATVFKVGYEQLNGNLHHRLEQSIEGMVVVDAHLYGLVSGLIVAGTLILIKQQNSHDAA